MHLEKAITETFEELNQVLVQLKNEEYTAQPDILNGSGIGQHCRHLLEIYVCLNTGYEAGIINYDDRKRDQEIEQYKEAALACMAEIISGLNRPEKNLVISASYSSEQPDPEEYKTSYKRELAYALEHAIHHLALIGVAIKAVAPHVIVPENFGVARSTIKYRMQSSQ